MWIYKKFLLLVLVLTAPATVACGDSTKQDSQNNSLPAVSQNSHQVFPASNKTGRYTYKVVNTFPHDTDAFTQGLVFNSGYLYEGTGLHGQSSLRKVDLVTGNVLQTKALNPEFFGEGITILGNKIIQLTWKNHKGFIYDKTTFELSGDFTLETEGWGITTDGIKLFMSDGTSILRTLDASSYKVSGEIHVLDDGQPVNNLNELEWVDGLIYANVWLTDSIVIIDPDSGRVKGRLDLKGLLQPQVKPVDVLNGIAYDAGRSRLFVTGKYWPSVFEIEIVGNPD